MFANRGDDRGIRMNLKALYKAHGKYQKPAIFWAKNTKNENSWFLKPLAFEVGILIERYMGIVRDGKEHQQSDACDVGVHFKIHPDPRVTRVQFRTTSITFQLPRHL